jgi:hypothetical protein
MKKRSFFYHYNKPESRKRGHNILTLHFKGACHLVRGIICHVGTETKERKRQPHCVVAGKCFTVTIDKEGKATIL